MGSEMCIRDRSIAHILRAVFNHRFQARSFQQATPYSPYPKLGPQNPTSHSTRTKSAQGLATSQATKPPNEIVHIKYIYCLLMASRLFVIVSGGQGKCRCVPRNASWPDFVEKRRPIQVSSLGTLVVLIPYCAISRAPSGIACRGYARS